MNYSIHYERLIARARDRVLDGYVERHHVIPKCMGGSDAKTNLVQLTGREHWLAHKLLIFVYPDNRRLVHAAVWMAKRAANGRVHEWLRKRHAIAVGDTHRGKTLSVAHVARLRETHRGNQYNKGRILSDAHKRKVGAFFKGKTLTDEHRAKIAAGNRGKPFSEERKAKLRAPKTPEHRAKLSAAKLAYHARMS